MALLVGIMVTVLGGILYYCGYSHNNSMDAQMESIFNNGVANPGSDLELLGLALILVGVILAIYGIFRETGQNTHDNGSESSRSDGVVRHDEHIVKEADEVVVGICEMCEKEAINTRLCTLKNAMGTRYRFMCPQCIASYKSDNPHAGGKIQTIHPQTEVVGRCQLCEKDDEQLRLCTLKDDSGSRNLFMCNNCIASYDFEQQI